MNLIDSGSIEIKQQAMKGVVHKNIFVGSKNGRSRLTCENLLVIFAHSMKLESAEVPKNVTIPENDDFFGNIHLKSVTKKEML